MSSPFNATLNGTASVVDTQTPVNFLNLPYMDQLAILIPYYVYQCAIPAPVVTFAAFITLAVGIIYFAALTTISKPRTAKDPVHDRQSLLYDPTDRDDSPYLRSSVYDLMFVNGNTINWKLAMAYPVMGAGVLYSLYYSLQNWDTAKLMNALNWYVLALTPHVVYCNAYHLATFATRRLAHALQLPRNSGAWFPRYRISISSTNNDDEDLPLGVIENVDCVKLTHNDYNDRRWFKKFKVFCRFENGVKILKPTAIATSSQIWNYVFDLKGVALLPVVLAVTGGFYWLNPVLNPQYTSQTTNWLVTDVVGVNFAIFGIKQTRVPSVKIASILLSGLFLYDVYFVFGTKLMASVATGLDIPIKILIPGPPPALKQIAALDSGSVYQSLASNVITNYRDIPTSLLGLGDIVLPGSLLALLVRFDCYQYYQQLPSRVSFHHLRQFPKPYFHVGVASYVVSLIITAVVLTIFKTGQPALLYIVPSMFLGVGVFAWRRGEFGQLWSFSEEMKEFGDKPRTKKDIEYAKLPKPATMGLDEESESDDEDYVVEDDGEESYDEWEDQKEQERSVINVDTDDDDFDAQWMEALRKQNKQLQVSYQFAESSDEEDDTFVIENYVEEDDDDDDESGDESDAYADDKMELAEEACLLRADLKYDSNAWYD